MDNTNNTTKYYVGMVVAMLFWGVAWTAGKVAAEHSNAEVAAFWRYAISFITIIPVIWYLKTPMKSDMTGFLYMLASGVLTSIFNYLFFTALSHGQAGYGGTMVTALSPLLTYVMSIAIFGTKVSTRQIMALSVGVLGALLLLRVPYEGFAFLNVESSYFLGCGIVWAIITIIAQKGMRRADPMFYTFVVFGITGFINMLFALPHHPFDFGAYDAIFWSVIFFIGLVPGTFGMAIFLCRRARSGHTGLRYLCLSSQSVRWSPAGSSMARVWRFRRCSGASVHLWRCFCLI